MYKIRSNFGNNCGNILGAVFAFSFSLPLPSFVPSFLPSFLPLSISLFLSLLFFVYIRMNSSLVLSNKHVIREKQVFFHVLLFLNPFDSKASLDTCSMEVHTEINLYFSYLLLFCSSCSIVSLAINFWLTSLVCPYSKVSSSPPHVSQPAEWWIPFIQGRGSQPWGIVLWTGWSTAAPLQSPHRIKAWIIPSSISTLRNIWFLMYLVVTEFLIHTNTLKFITSLGALSTLSNSLIDFR